MAVRRMCLVPDCFQKAKGYGLACSDHYQMVPKELRTRWLSAWRSGNEPERHAAMQEILEILTHGQYVYIEGRPARPG